MTKSSFVFTIALFTLSCSAKNPERKIAIETITETTDEQEGPVKKMSAVELDCQFKGCKAHW